MNFMPALKIGICNAWIFMSVFILQMMVIMFARESIRKKSHVPEEVKQTKRDKYTGIIANVVWLVALGYSFFLPLKLNTIWFYTGLIIFIIGLIIITAATYSFISTPSAQLITKGIYTFSRHPMYLSTFFICLGTGIASASWIFIFISIIMALFFYKEMLIEERFCLGKYGNFYKEYSERVPRWIGLPKKV